MVEDNVPVTIYEPNQQRGGILWGLRQAFQEISLSRHVIARLFWRDFVAQFRQKILGYFWALLGPLFGILSFLFLFFVGVLEPGEGEIPYTVYVFVGSTIWACLPGSMGAVGNGLQTQADLILRTRIPKLALAISSLATVSYNLLISMITMALVLALMGFKPSWWFLAYPLLALPMVLLGTALGLVLSVLGTIAKDLVTFATQILSLFMYLTPVIYLHSSIQNRFIKTLVDFNPVTYLVEVPRSLICLGKAEHLDIYFWSVLGTFVLVSVGLRIFYLLEDLVAERL